MWTIATRARIGDSTESHLVKNCDPGHYLEVQAKASSFVGVAFAVLKVVAA
jgi:hypothetical protein